MHSSCKYQTQLCILAETFSAERRNIDVLSTDLDSSAEGSVGGESSLWESSDRNDVPGDESGDNSTQLSGSISDNNGFGDTGDEHLQAISTQLTDSGIEGDNEEPIPGYELRPRIKSCVDHQLSVVIMVIPVMKTTKL